MCVCVWKWFRHFYVFVAYCYFLVYLVLCVCIYGMRGGMHDTELLEDRGRGERIFVGPDQLSDVEPDGQGQAAFYKFMHILGKAFVDHTALAGTAAHFLFVSLAFVMKWD